MADRLDLEEGSQEEYSGPAGGYGSLRSVVKVLATERIPGKGARALGQQNKPEGFMCVSCAWAKPAEPLPAEFCENGAKATAWEITDRRAGDSFFETHTLTELERWRDHDLEAAGRLTRPMRWDKATDRYVPVDWSEAFAEIGRELQAQDPRQTVYYTSGRASLETSYLFQLLARLHGSNNLPDSSNMCHESSSVALPDSIGSTVGTAGLDDFETCDGILLIAQNVGTNAPRMLHQLQQAAKRSVPIIVINPLRERGTERFTNPQSPLEMATGHETRIGSQFLQVKVGGDIAALFGICKALIELDDAARQGDGVPRQGPVLDHEFIARHTIGFEAFAEAARAHPWAELERVSGLTRVEMTAVAHTYAACQAVLGIYGMGLTQHAAGVQNVQMVVNLLLLRGNIGKPGAGVCPVRGHSNVQGQRTVGITEKPELVPLDRLAEQFGFEPPRWKGLDTVEACKAIVAESVTAFVALGGNFLRAVPETEAVEAGWRKLRLTVQIATKLNRSHLVHGEVAYLLPCLGRIEIDRQAGGAQAVSVESSIAHFHGSRGVAEPASDELRSEPWILAGIAKATLPPNPLVPWDAWVADYGTIRDSIEATWPDVFPRFNERLFEPGGIPRPVPARRRQWGTPSGKAQFRTPDLRFAGTEPSGDPADVLQLTTLRSNDQFNTTVYGYSDRFRGVEGTRHVVFVNQKDIARLGLVAGQLVDLVTAVEREVERMVRGMQLVPYDIPEGCAAAYFPECNPLVPLWHHDPQSKVPGYKAVPVRLRASGTGAASVAVRDASR